LLSKWFFALFSALTVTIVSAGFGHAAEPSPERQSELVHLVRQDCGSCHGMTLQGGLGPALLPASLKDKPVESLVATIYSGRPGTPMPPWKQFMTEAEASWIVDKLMTEFPH
jgi:cytochrome c55X